MVHTVKPSKEQVREYMARRHEQHHPPQTLEEIRRQLGWDLIAMERAERKHRKYMKQAPGNRGP